MWPAQPSGPETPWLDPFLLSFLLAIYIEKVFWDVCTVDWVNFGVIKVAWDNYSRRFNFVKQQAIRNYFNPEIFEHGI